MELRFRAWDIETKEFYKVYSLHLRTRKAIIADPPLGNISIPFDDIILEEFLGFRDDTRNNKFPDGIEVYEGDILRLFGGEYYQGRWEYDYIIDISKYNYMELASSEHIVIVGNIHTNPEMLKVFDDL